MHHNGTVKSSAPASTLSGIEIDALSYVFMPQTGWGVTLPWLEYVEEALDVRDGTDIEMHLTFESEMKIVLAKYGLDGKWLGMEDMSTQVRARLIAWVRGGRAF